VRAASRAGAKSSTIREACDELIAENRVAELSELLSSLKVSDSLAPYVDSLLAKFPELRTKMKNWQQNLK